MCKQLLNILPKTMVGERRLELPTSWSRTMRATRLRYSPSHPAEKLNDDMAVELDLKIQDFLGKVQKFEKLFQELTISPQLGY